MSELSEYMAKQRADLMQCLGLYKCLCGGTFALHNNTDTPGWTHLFVFDESGDLSVVTVDENGRLRVDTHDYTNMKARHFMTLVKMYGLKNGVESE